MSSDNNAETTIKAASLFSQASKLWGKGKSARRNSDEETHPLDTESEGGDSQVSLSERLKFWKKVPGLREKLNDRIQNM